MRFKEIITWKIATFVLLVCLVVSVGGGLWWLAEKNEQITLLESENSSLTDQLAAVPEPLQDPSLEEVTTFVEGYTNENPYIWPAYTTWEFARSFQESAEDQGFRCGIVKMALASGHFTFLIVFDVPGVGFIYVEPQTPVQIVVVEVGQPYCQPNGWPQPPYDDTIEYLTSQPDWS